MSVWMRSYRMMALFTVVFTSGSTAVQAEDLASFARRFTNVVYNERQREKIPDFVHAEFVDHSPGAPADARGPEYVARQYDGTFGAFPDLRFTVEDVITEGDKAVIRWVSHATFTGQLGSVHGNGQASTVHGISIFRIQDGKIIESWDLVDRLAMLRQAGFKLEPPRAPEAPAPVPRKE